MRIILFFASFIFTLSAISQERKDSLIKYWGVEKVESAKKDILYNRARGWFNTSFNSGKEVLEIQDKENGQLSGNGSFTTYFTYTNIVVQSDLPVLVKYKVNVYVRDGKYKYDFSDLTPMQSAQVPFSVLTTSKECPDRIPMTSQRKMDKFWLQLKDNVDKHMQSTIANLKETMASASPIETDF